MGRGRGCWLLALLLVHVLLFWRVPCSGFVTDDFLWLEDAGRSQTPWQHALSREPFGYLRPLFHLVMASSRACFGFDATALHMLALVCSLVSVWLLFGMVRRLTGSAAAAGAAALWLTVHPAQAIAVSWVSSLPSLLATSFALGAVRCWQRWLRRGGAGGALASLVLHALALLSKEEAVVLSVAFVLWWATSQVPRARLALAHVGLTGGYLLAWWSLGGAQTPFVPVGADWWAAAADPLLRAKALWLQRHAVTSPFAELTLLALAFTWWRAAPRLCSTWMASAALAVLALVPSSVGLWGFRWDKLDRLLLPAVPAAALVVGLWTATWWRRRGAVRAFGVGLVVVLLGVFAVHSHKTVGRRVADADRVRELVAALAEHGPRLRQAARDGRAVALVGFAVDWSHERGWIYPSGPARAVAPGLQLLPTERAAEAAFVLRWNPATRRFDEDG